MASVFTPYSTVKPLVRGMPQWVPEIHQERISSYQKYEEIFWNADQAFEILDRDADQDPIYIPNARTVVNTTAHFLLKDLTIAPVDPEAEEEMTKALKAFMRREGFYSKFSIAKHSGVVRGDWILHLTGDPEQPQGRRLSLNSVDPAAYFPVTSDDDLDQIERVHLAEQFDDGSDEVKVKKLTYEYDTEGGERKVIRSEAIYPLDEWAEPSADPERVIHPPEVLPDPITTIPVYHFQNMGWQGQPFGSSELRGFEKLLSSVNQSITDEDLALALQGLGVFATNASRPTDNQGNEMPWRIAPGSVIEYNDGDSFDRVKGVDSIEPMLAHINYLEEKLFEASGTTEVARGSVDVKVAESGVALAIQFIPTLAKIENRDKAAIDKLTQFWFDWKAWHKVYEGPDFREDPAILPSLGPKLPVNREAIRKELNDMVERQVISRAYYRQMMAEHFSYKFPENIEEQIIDEQARITEAMDMLGTRMNRELEE